jgi:hypothetical protein
MSEQIKPEGSPMIPPSERPENRERLMRAPTNLSPAVEPLTNASITEADRELALKAAHWSGRASGSEYPLSQAIAKQQMAKARALLQLPTGPQ